MTRDGLIVIVDTLIPTEKAKDFQFRANTAYSFTVKDRDRAEITAGEVRSDILFVYDGEYTVSVGKWAFNPGPGSYLTGDFKLRGEKARLITVMRPTRDGRAHTLTAALQGERLTVHYDGQIAEFEVE